MTGPLPTGTGLIAFPYEWEPPWMQPYNGMLLDEMERHPLFYSQPSTPEERRRSAAAMLVDSGSLRWGVWKESQFLGLLYLSSITPSHDSTVHFLFLDHNLVGKRALLRRFLRYCLTEIEFPGMLEKGFRRLTALVPDDADKLVRFYRQLGFRFEGEALARRSGYPVASSAPTSSGGARSRHLTATTIAKYGSRVEAYYWRDDQWIDMVRLCLLRSEWGVEDAGTSHRRSGGTNSGGHSREGTRPQTEPNHPPATG